MALHIDCHGLLVIQVFKKLLNQSKFSFHNQQQQFYFRSEDNNKRSIIVTYFQIYSTAQLKKNNITRHDCSVQRKSSFSVKVLQIKVMYTTVKTSP